MMNRKCYAWKTTKSDFRTTATDDKRLNVKALTLHITRFFQPFSRCLLYIKICQTFSLLPPFPPHLITSHVERERATKKRALVVSVCLGDGRHPGEWHKRWTFHMTFKRNRNVASFFFLLFDKFNCVCLSWSMKSYLQWMVRTIKTNRRACGTTHRK